MACFDLSVLSILQEKFEHLENKIKDIKGQRKIIEESIATIDKVITEKESEKVDLMLRLNEKKEEELKLQQLFEDTTQQYELVKESATQPKFDKPA